MASQQAAELAQKLKATRSQEAAGALEGGLRTDDVGAGRGAAARERYQATIETLRSKVAALEAQVAEAEAAAAAGGGGGGEGVPGQDAVIDDEALRRMVLAKATGGPGSRSVVKGKLDPLRALGEDAGDDDDDDDGDEGGSGPRVQVTPEHVAELASVAGVHFDRTHNSLLEPDAERNGLRLRRYELQGTSHGLGFALHFDVNEEALRVERVEVEVDKLLTRELSGLVTHVEETCSLRAFFKTFARFAKLRSLRTALFRTLKIEYGEWVVLPHGAANSATMVVAAPSSGDGSAPFEFTFLWQIASDTRGKLEQNIQIFPSVSLGLVELDAEASFAVTAELTTHFRKLVAWGGVTAALRVLIGIVRSGKLTP
ncbi:centromere protein P [Thecamonas trahens ATCC 50062]|uniref:Centromere protein P n=1 Tax=Thecamonas trahens ATCC 50062 TaxID=461836 RepID=A0A0L0DIW7_THETB|nr:centromere protein P [Thecamonas trahens ATCC 50062]KNC52242.1 centromere protein P [Thecamonas trahens ATCC 50062]|eukprot:XP_013762244.1 centromere protein P [Thecamonas trahens ATCC 50062]